MEYGNLARWEEQVKSGDSESHEARAAAYYWKTIFSNFPNGASFIREREGAYPNNFLNFGYAILRAVIARNLVGSGLLPLLGIHHRNQYNDYCLADDIMEPYRPYIDKIVYDLMLEYPHEIEMNTQIKKKLLQIPAMDINIEGVTSPLMVGVQRTTHSLYKCVEGEARKIIYPTFI